MFIGRRQDHSIYGAWLNKQPDDEFHTNIEEVADDHPEYIAFKNRVIPVVIDPRDIKIAELEARLVSLESAANERTR